MAISCGARDKHAPHLQWQGTAFRRCEGTPFTPRRPRRPRRGLAAVLWCGVSVAAAAPAGWLATHASLTAVMWLSGGVFAVLLVALGVWAARSMEKPEKIGLGPDEDITEVLRAVPAEPKLRPVFRRPAVVQLPAPEPDPGRPWADDTGTWTNLIAVETRDG